MSPTFAVGAIAFVLLTALFVLGLHARSLAALLRARAAREDDLQTDLENAVKAQRKAESVANSRDQLATMAELSATIAHEIRNPLSIIGNATATLRHKDLTEDDHTTLLDILEHESARLNRFLTDLVSFSKPLSLELVPLHLKPILDRASAVLLHDLETVKDGETSPQIEVKVSEPEPTDTVLGDNNLLGQVFDNLMSNAAQAIGDTKGRIDITLSPHKAPEGPGVNVVIADSGRGMEGSVRERAKLPFFSTKPGKAGLGLAIVMRFIEAHGGKLEITSTVGKGTSVRVFLPRGGLPQAAISRTKLQ